MRNAKPSLWIWVVSVAGLTVLGWLALLSAQNDSPAKRIEALVPVLLNGEHTMKVDIVRMRYGLDNNYDILNADMAVVQANLAKLDAVSAGTELSAPLAAYRAIVVREANQVETFKYQNAVTRNSLHYFQSDAIHLLEDLPHAGGGQELQHKLTRLENAVLLLTLGADEYQADQARSLIGEVRNSSFPLTASQRETLDRLLRHAVLLVREQPKLEATTRALFDSGSRRQLSELDSLASAAVARRQALIERAQMGLGLVSVAVFGAMVFLVRRHFQNLGQIAAQRRFLQSLTDNVGVGVMVADPDDRLTFVNPQAAGLLGYRQEELLGRHMHEGIHVNVDGSAIAQAECPAEINLQAGENYAGEQYYRCKDGRIIPVLLHAAAIPDGDAGRLILVFQDMSEIYEARRRMEQLAYYDPLTGLPNRVLFQDRVAQALARARREGHSAAFMMVDLDNFKSVNDSLGHAAGDELLKLVASRIESSIRESDTAARLGGDEFAIFIPDADNPDDAASFANKLLNTIREPYRLGGLDVVCGASLGITLFPQDAGDADGLMRNADTAMFRAKEAGKQRFQFYTEDMGIGAMERLRMESLLRNALERGEFELLYQPQFMPDGTLVGAEALLRWNSPELGPVQPPRFIPVAERSGLIVEIGEWVLYEASRQCSQWRQTHPAFRMAINLSAIQFRHAGLAERVAYLLGQVDLSGEALELEITETMLMENVTHNQGVLSSLKQLGCLLAIDDFGTGYSSLSYLKRFQVDVLKIDKTFVDGLGTDANDSAVVRAIISLARNLDLAIVAEGVETEGQLNELRRYDQGDIMVQGYYFSRPIAADEFEQRYLSEASS